MNDISDLSPKQRVYLAVTEMQSRLEAIEKARHEPIAVVGIGCRFPGGAHNPEDFWRLLRDGVDAITEVPSDRWDVDAFYDPDLASTRTMNTRWGGFLARVDEFDHAFFGISRNEASSIDPQQRLLLETSWEALENAGLAPDQLAGSPAGVFIGISTWDYSTLHLEAPTRGATGIVLCIAANRISYCLDLRGPSMAVDTACSSSLVAVDLACQSLRSGTTDLALAGGVNLILAPYLTVSVSQAGMMAPDGRCKTFDEAANGYVRGEGCGVVALKRLSDAIEDRHDIIGLICGSAVNQDGRSNGLTAPNGLAQQRVIRQALKQAGISPRQIGYFETHGTGTTLGDTVEVESLQMTIGEGRTPDQPCYIGSVKTNIGHLEPAAGIAGLIKVLLALKHEEIPPHLHFKRINPNLKMDHGLRIPTSRCAWPRTDQPRFAGVNSFGFGGTNAHVVVREAPLQAEMHCRVERPIHILALSAKSQKALGKLAMLYADHLAANAAARLPNICYTANAGRSHFDHRLAVWAASAHELYELLKTADITSSPRQRRGTLKARNRSRIAFSFTGSPHPGMGRRLYETQPTFRKVFDQCQQVLGSGQPLLGSDSPAALFAVEYALARLWQSWGLEPSLVMGQGVGEVVAACIAGAAEWKDGLSFVAEGGACIDTLPLQPLRIPMSSNITGQVFQSADADLILEIGFKQNEDDWETLLSSLANLYVGGAAINWRGFDQDYERQRLALPSYPFERARCWLEPSELRPLPAPLASGPD